MKMIYFKPGELVRLKAEIPYAPVMIVKEVKKTKFRVLKTNKDDKEDERGVLLGISCFWFTSDYQYQEAIFNTKDLIKYED